MKNKIALIEIMIHHLKNVQVAIRLPTSYREVNLIEIAHAKAMIWAKESNLKTV